MMIIMSAKKRFGFSVLLPIIFLSILLLPTMDSCFHLDHVAAPEEKRHLAEFPVYKGGLQIKQFMAGLESCFNDHFGFRKRLVRTNNQWKRQLFAEANLNGRNGYIMIGGEGWLYYCGDKIIENYKGEEVFSQQDLKDWQTVLEARRDWLVKRGCGYVLVIPADKHLIYPEYLPSWFKKRELPLKLDQFLDYMRANSTVKILDLRPCLVDAKKVMPTYLMTDTHWNAYGGFIGYQALMNSISNVFPDLAPLPFSAFTFEAPANSPGGDMDRTANEHAGIIRTPQPPATELVVTRDVSRLPNQWTKDREPLITLNTNATRKAVVFRDSYSRSWYDLIGQHFHEVLFIWQYDWDRAFLDREKPDLVIDEILSRYLVTMDPKALMEKDLGSETNKFAVVNP